VIDGKRIVVSAPGRAGLLGNPSDMYGGSVIAMAIDRRAFVSIEPADSLRLVAVDADLSVEVGTDVDLKLIDPPSMSASQLMDPGQLMAARRATYLNVLKAVVAAQEMRGAAIEIRCWSDIPPNAGLSSSSALLVAALRATDAWLGRQYRFHEFAERAREIEFSRMKIICGFQDFYATASGGLSYLDFRGKAEWREADIDPFATVEPLPTEADSIPMVLAHTGRQRDSGETHRPLRERWVKGDPAVRAAMERLASIARHGKRYVLAGDWITVAEQMNEAHVHMASVDGSGPENDALIELAIRLGARGAKLAGAGKGGTIIALHEEPQFFAKKLLANRVESAFAINRLVPGVVLHPDERGGSAENN
jgi:galactokinase/mevalonate kinase-like predicted kinase